MVVAYCIAYMYRFKNETNQNAFLADSNLLSDVAYVLCLDGIGKSDEMYLHVSKPPKEDSPGHHFLQVFLCSRKSISQSKECLLTVPVLILHKLLAVVFNSLIYLVCRNV